MRRVTLGESGIEASCLGFGCASLGSRVAAADGVRALAEAFEAGVTWFDLAPVYGAGAAEAIAAPFLRRNRARVQIATKAGLGLAGGAGGGLRRAALPLARRLVAAVGPLGAWLRRAAPAANAKLPLTPALVGASLEASLRRLGTDHVDLFALHDPTPEEVGREEIRRALEAILAAGKARAVAVAGDAAAAAAALTAGPPYAAVQLPLPPPGAAAALATLAAARAAGRGTLVHSVIRAGGADPVGRAFALNPDGVVLVSMFSAASRAANLAAAARPPEGSARDGRGTAPG